MATNQDEEIFKNLSFPLPYRVLFLLGLGIFGWAANLHGLNTLGIDVVGAMGLRTEAPTSKPVMPVHHSTVFNHTKAVLLYKAAYRLCWSYSTFIFSSWIVFRLLTHGDRSLVDQYGFIPGVTAFAAVYLIFCPHDILLKIERDKFTAAIRRCIFPGTGPIYFSDVILADIATSFAKVFGDIWQSLWMVKPGNSILRPPVHDNWLRWIMPTMMSIPFFIRFRQCMVEYTAPGNESRKPLYNAFKYATSFPVIFLSAAQRLVVADLVKEKGKSAVAGEPWHGEHPLFRLWLMAAVVNSLYAFWWDITNDWGLDLFRFEPSENHERHPPKPLILARLHSGSSTPLLDRDPLSLPPDEQFQFSNPPKQRYRQTCHGLRSVLHYPRAIYPVLIFLNLLLRMTWSVKLSTHVQSPRDGSFAFFWLEVAELVRRWLWVFLRVEWEVVKTGEVSPVPRSSLFQVEDHSDEGDFEMLPTSPDITSGTSDIH